MHSVYNTLKYLGLPVDITQNPQDLQEDRPIILPGVGAFGRFMEGLRQQNLIEALSGSVQRGNPLLGICVGMQALFESGEEMGDFAGLGFLAGKVIHFPPLTDVKVPHTGWNQLEFTDTPLMKGLEPGCYAYFNHSYYCLPQAQEDIAIYTQHEISFASAVQHEAVFGVQFHPEKSQQVGQTLLKNFFNL